MKFLKNLLILSVFVLITNFADGSDNFPSTIERCKNEDKKCILKLWNKYLNCTGDPKGIPELGIASFQKYFVPKASIAPGSGPLDIKLKMRNFDLTGINNAVADKITGFPRDPKDMTKFEVMGHCPLVGIKGKYNVTGKVLLLPVAGDDEGEVRFYNVKFNLTVLTTTKMVDGEEYLVISKVLFNYISERNFYRFENLLKNKEISDSINSVLNENQDIINNEVRGPVGKIFAELFKKFFIAAFDKYPYSSFFLKA